MPDAYEPFSIFIMAPGAFFVLAILTGIQNRLKLKSATNGDAKEESTLACGGKCDECVGGVCAANRSLLAIEADDKKASRGENIASRLKAFPEGTDKEAASDKSKGGDRS